MINTPKDLSDIEVGLYKSGYGICEKLVKEEHMTIAAAVEKTALLLKPLMLQWQDSRCCIKEKISIV